MQDLKAFEAVLLDYNLPDYDGLVMLKELLDRCDVPVIVVTGENITQTASQAVKAGAADYVVKLGDYLFALPIVIDKNIRQHRLRCENRRLQGELQSMLHELQAKNLQLEESLEQQRKMATTDHLTGLSNRRHFAEALERYFQEATRYGFDLTCCMCDLDHYKQLNDMLGHQIGDQVLVIAAEVIRSSLRTTDLAVRYGGDEFVLLLPHTSMDMGVAAGQRIREQLVTAMLERNLFHLPVTMFDRRGVTGEQPRLQRRPSAVDGGQGAVRGQGTGKRPDRVVRGAAPSRRTVRKPGTHPSAPLLLN